MFETYFVNGDNKTVAKAIEKNGDVVIKFFKEKKEFYGNGNTIFLNNSYGTYTSPITYTPQCYYSSCAGIRTNSVGALTKSCTSSVNSDSLDFLNSDNERSITNSGAKKLLRKSIETGRVEQGSNSDQKFKTDNTNFEFSYTWISTWKLLPESQKNVTSDEITLYCSNCGRKKRNSENFCPKCGKKF